MAAQRENREGEVADSFMVYSSKLSDG
jgi:hypothetical protein